MFGGLSGFFGGGEEAADNEDVEHQSGASRMGNAIFAAICCAPFLMIGMVILLGWNEHRAVCQSKAIVAGKEVVKKIGCESADEGSGTLVMLNCEYKTDGLVNMSSSGAFAAMKFPIATGLKTESKMYQCIETSSSKSKKDSVGGGKTSTTTYTYSKEWKDEHVDSGSFHKKSSQNFIDNCGVDNPSWPSMLPQTDSKYAAKLVVGAVKTAHVSTVPLDKSIVDLPNPNSATWSKNGGVYSSSYQNSGTYTSQAQTMRIGDVKVEFKMNDWQKPRDMTLLGENVGGEIKAWTAPSDWLCKGFTLDDARMGTLSKDELFETLAGANNAITWIIRIVGFLVLWCAWSCLGGPLEVAADCVPCIGPYLGDMVEAVVCCVSCLPASACCMFVVGVCWIAMRPMVGIPLMLVCVIIFCSLGAYKYRAKQQRDEAKAGGGGGDVPLAAAPPAPQVYGGAPAYSGPVDPNVARDFLNAVDNEYVRGSDGAVGSFFDANGGTEDALGQFEERVRNADDKGQEIDNIAREWNLSRQQA